jgi:hypothetical protein
VAREIAGRRRARPLRERRAPIAFGGGGGGSDVIRSLLVRWRVPVALAGDLFVGDALMMRWQ